MATDASGEVARTDRFFLQLGEPQQPLATLDYERSLSAGAEPRVTRGSIAGGLAPGESVPMPAAGVQANIRFRQIDADAWERAFARITGVDPHATTQSTNGRDDDSASLLYLPTNLAVRAEQLLVGGRSFNSVVIGGSREGNQWRANVNAEQLNGYLEYRQPSGSFGRQRLRPPRQAHPRALGQGRSRRAAAATQQHAGARHRGRRLRAGRPPARALWPSRRTTRAAKGAPASGASPSSTCACPKPVSTPSATGPSRPGGGSNDARRTALQVELDIRDAGALLARFGQPGTVRGGQGTINGSVGWVGSPMSLDYASLSGQLHVDIKSGQFLKVDPGAAKLLGVLSLQSLPRRLVLDFRDLFSEGFAFDFVRGDATIAQGVARTNNLQMKGINAAVLMDGSADIANETQDLKVVVVPEINAGTAALIATAINPAIGLGTFLAQFLLSQPLQSAATQEFRITGEWADPQVDKVDRRAAASTPPRSLQ